VLLYDLDPGYKEKQEIRKNKDRDDLIWGQPDTPDWVDTGLTDWAGNVLELGHNASGRQHSRKII